MTHMYFANTDRFPHDTLEGETVLIDTERGHLFLFTGIGPWLWQRLTAGTTFETIVQEVVSRFGPEAAEPTWRFLEQLEQNEMVRQGVPGDEAPTPIQEIACPDLFVAPAIERYDQIADIISMDPIHEVDPAEGWPHRQHRQE